MKHSFIAIDVGWSVFSIVGFFTTGSASETRALKILLEASSLGVVSQDSNILQQTFAIVLQNVYYHSW